MRLFLPFIIVILTTILNSCGTETIEDAKQLSLEKDYKLVKKSTYEVKIPNYMKSTHILNLDASLQYLNDLKKEYIIIIDEPKNEFIDALKELGEYTPNQKDLISYRDAQFMFTEQQMEIKTRTDFNSLTINGLDVEAIEIEAKLDKLEEPVSYYFYYIDGGDQLYTIMAWTVTSKKNVYREKIKKLIQTFNTLKTNC